MGHNLVLERNYYMGQGNIQAKAELVTMEVMERHHPE